MFDWFKNIGRPKYPTWDDVPPPSDMEKIASDINKVLPFPEPYKVDVKPPESPKEPVGKTVYSVGLTDDNRVSLIVGYGSIHMNSVGVQQLIDQLTLFKNQIEKTKSE